MPFHKNQPQAMGGDKPDLVDELTTRNPHYCLRASHVPGPPPPQPANNASGPARTNPNMSLPTPQTQASFHHPRARPTSTLDPLDTRSGKYHCV